MSSFFISYYSYEKYVPKEVALKSKTKMSRICVIILALMMCISGIVMPQVAEATDSNDKTEHIKPTITGEVSQNGKEVTDQIDPAKPFDVTVNFKFSVINDALIGGPLAGDITENSQQVNVGDYADFTLGENFKATEATGNSIPVYIKAPGNPDDGKQVGTITLTQNGTGPVNARMNFHNPKGDFNFESDTLKELTVHFTGHYQAQEQSSGTPGSNDRTVIILKKEYKFPEVPEKITYDFTKSGKLDDSTKRDSITWESNIKKTSDKGSTKLGGETFVDVLPSEVEYTKGTLTINGKAVEDKEFYDDENRTISYTFPQTFDKDEAKIVFQTNIKEPGKTTSVTNEAKLKIPNEKEKRSKTTVTVHRDLEIKKNLQKINVNKENGERELIWTIVAGAPNESFGPAWIGDILSSKSDNMKGPKRVSLSYEHSMTGDDGTWTPVEGDEKVEILDQDAANKFPSFPEGENKECPNLGGYDKEIYQLGKGWHNPTKPDYKNGEYKPIENHWVYVKNLDGLYRITVKLIYDKDTEINSLKNDAEIHTCAKTVYPKNPPVYSGIGTISKSAMKSYDDKVINQGQILWNITVDFSNVFPSDKQFVYEAFYYGSEEKFKEEKGNLNVDGKLDKDVLKSLIDGEKGETYFNFNQGYVKGSLDYKKGGVDTPEQDKINLAEDIIPLLNAEGKQVGEVLKISGFTKIQKYDFKLKTRAQDIVSKAIEKTTSSFEGKYENTAVLAVGSGDTFKTVPASSIFELPSNLLNKYAIENDVDLNSMDSVSKNGWKSGYRDFVTGIPEVDKTKTFNYKDRSILFRIDVNPQGLKLNEYIESLGEKPEGDFTKLTIKDTLQEGLTLEPIEENGPDFYIYEAKPGEAAFIDYSMTFPGSAKFSSYLPPGKALKKITPEEAGVNFNKEQMSWNFDNYQGTPYFIVIRTKVSEAKFEEIMKKTAQGEEISFKNSVSMEAGDNKLATASGSASVNSYILSKETPKVAGDNLEWTFNYKPFDIEFKNVVIKDELDKNITIPIDEDGNALLDNFIIERSNKMQADGSYEGFENVTPVMSNPEDGEVSVRYEVNEHCIYFDVPDTKEGEKPYSYKFTYKTSIKPVDLNAETIKNHVEMSAKDEEIGANGNSEIKTQKYAAFATIKDYPYFVIKKVDENNKPLAGAVFQYTDNTDSVVNAISDKDGMVYIIKLKAGETEITEIKAPEGYINTDKLTKISIDDNKNVTVVSPTDGKGNGKFNDPFIVQNDKVKTTDISVTKKWVGDKPEDRPESITVNLLKNGEPMEDMSLTLAQSNSWMGKFENMPLTDEDGNTIEYTISEDEVQGYTSNITGNIEDGFVITNTKPEPEEPGEPEEPDKPDKPDKSDKPGKPKSPGTGDNGFGYAWSAMTVVAALGILYLKRKNEYSE